MVANETVLRGLCPAPFFEMDKFPSTGGYIDGRICQQAAPGLYCCLPCPLTDWAYPDNFDASTKAASWVTVASMVCCAFLLISWLVLPVEKTHRHYLSVSVTCAVVLMNLGFVVPLAANPQQCYNEITPNSMHTSKVCAASGSFLLIGGWAGVMWVFLRSLSLHLQICWQMVVGRTFMWFAHGFGWGIPVLGLALLLVFSGVSFRFGATCHINHENSLADFWIPLLVFAGLTLVLQFATFGYCIRVYLASLADSGATTEGSGPTYTASIRTMTPRQAYRRVRRVVALQWRGIVIVLIIIADVIFFAIVFVFQDSTVQSAETHPEKVEPWVICLTTTDNKNECLKYASALVVNLATIVAVLILLAMNGIWLFLLLGTWSMVTGWIEFFKSFGSNGNQKEFVSVDAGRMDYKKDSRSYEMLSRDSVKTGSVLTATSPSKSPIPPMSPPRTGRQTPDYFSSQTKRYTPHSRSFSSPRPPQQDEYWDPSTTHAAPQAASRMPRGYDENGYMNPLGMNRI